MEERISVKFGGQSGQGINLLGQLISRALKESNYHIFGYREYPSIIKGGFASYQIDFGSSEILSPEKKCDILACIAQEALEEYLFTVSSNGVIFHSVKDFEFSKKAKEYINKNSIKVIYIDLRKMAQEQKAPAIMENMIMLGSIWKVLGQDINTLNDSVVRYFSKKKGIDIEAEKRCLNAGYFLEEIKDDEIKDVPKSIDKNWEKSLILTGNQAVALGAISAGCRAYYAYPMTPSTPILELLGDTYMKTGILVKQAESEITAVQMVLGSMYMGARAFTATSGGGFDLMTESISMSAMTEIPLVIVLGQRAGASTGLPTWTGASDIDVAVHSGHGEFPRCVLAANDPIESYELIQEAFNIAEVYQLPVILLTEKHVAESMFNILNLPKAKKIKRGLSQNGTKRYLATKSGISPRWLPMPGRKTYLTNSDEHNEYGVSSESDIDTKIMTEKRMRKVETLSKTIPAPKYFGDKDPTIVFVGMGSVKNAVLDAMKISRRRIGYLHYKYIYPLKYEKILQFAKDGVKIVLIENNFNNGFGRLIKEESDFYITNTLKKYNGRPFFVDDILEYLKQ